jgi:hypothetical protein
MTDSKKPGNEIEVVMQKRSNKRPNEVGILVRITTDEATLWHDESRTAYATLPDGRNLPTTRELFRLWLLERYYRKKGKGPSQQSTQQAIDTLSAMAIFDHPEHRPHYRAARAEGKIFIDLADSENRVVQVSAAGWQIIELKRCPVRFIATKNARPLPVPANNGNIYAFWDLVNVPESLRPRIALWLFAGLGATTPYPVLAIEGCQGSAKSTVAKTVRRLVDPNASDLRSPPKTEKDLAACANNSHVLAFDNVSYLSPTMSDALCRVATGAGLGARKYYTQDEEILIEMRQPIIINGIASLLTRPDLASRSLLVRLPEISEEDRITEDEYWDRFDSIKAGVFGALLDALAYGLGNPAESVRLPRMADVARWGTSCAPALGYSVDEFARAVLINAEEVLRMSVEGDWFIDTLRDFIDHHHRWEGTAKGLYRALERHANLVDKPKPADWPDSPRGVVAKLDRTKEALAAWGITVTKSKTRIHGYHRWTIEFSPEPPF